MDQTISSKQIADLLNNCKHKYQNISHNSVKRTIERQADRDIIVFTTTDIVDKVFKKKTVIYHVDENDSYIVVAHIAPELIDIIVEYWRGIVGDDVDLKSLIVEQGKKINKIYALLSNQSDIIDQNLKPQSKSVSAKDNYYIPSKRHKKRHLRAEDVEKIKYMHLVDNLRDYEIVEKTGMCRSTITRVLDGERDYLLNKKPNQG